MHLKSLLCEALNFPLGIIHLIVNAFNDCWSNWDNFLTRKVEKHRSEWKVGTLCSCCTCYSFNFFLSLSFITKRPINHFRFYGLHERLFLVWFMMIDLVNEMNNHGTCLSSECVLWKLWLCPGWKANEKIKKNLTRLIEWFLSQRW